jgi:hypothetical protein
MCVEPGLIPPSTKYEQVIDIDGILGIATFHTGNYLVVITSKKRVGRILPDASTDVYFVSETKIFPISRGQRTGSDTERLQEDHFLGLLKRAIKDSFMYFSYQYDLTTCIQKNQAKKSEDSLFLRVFTPK